MKRAKKDPRPWCSCGKVRLASKHAMHTEETDKRLWLHQSDKCCCWTLNRSERKEAAK